MKLLYINEFFKNKKIISLSLITNSLAIGLSFIIGFLYTSYKQQVYMEKYNHTKLKWHDYLIAFLLSFATALTAFSIVFVVSGYLPMSRARHI